MPRLKARQIPDPPSPAPKPRDLTGVRLVIDRYSSASGGDRFGWTLYAKSGDTLARGPIGGYFRPGRAVEMARQTLHPDYAALEPIFTWGKTRR